MKTSNAQHPTSNIEGRKPLVLVKYHGLQSGCGVTRSIALFNVVAGPVDLLKSTRTVESLEAEGYDVREEKLTADSRELSARQEAA